MTIDTDSTNSWWNVATQCKNQPTGTLAEDLRTAGKGAIYKPAVSRQEMVAPDFDMEQDSLSSTRKRTLEAKDFRWDSGREWSICLESIIQAEEFGCSGKLLLGVTS
jgi:hypothetical protein